MFKLPFNHRTITQKDGQVWRDEDDREYIPFAIEECEDDLDVNISKGVLQFHVKTIRGPSRGIDAVLKTGDTIRLRPQKQPKFEFDFVSEATRLLDESGLKPSNREEVLSLLAERLQRLSPKPTLRRTIDFEVVKFFMIRDRSLDKEIIRPAGVTRPASASYMSRNTGIVIMEMIKENWDDVFRIYGTEAHTHKLVRDHLFAGI